jgi:antitoxin MazE
VRLRTGYARIFPTKEAVMSRVTIGRWGKNLALRVPSRVAQAAGLSEGEQVELEARDADIVIRRPHARADAQTAAEEIIRESRRHRLGNAAIRRLTEDGRRG